MPEAMVACPLCSSSVLPRSLEAHLRLELSYSALACELCSRLFLDDASAEAHFRGPLARHPEAEVRLVELRDPLKEGRLMELLEKARPKDVACQRHCPPECRTKAPQTGATEVSQLPVLPPQDSALMPYPMTEHVTSLDRNPVDERASEREDSEPLTPALFVKAELLDEAKDVKPFASDGKVACLKCGLRIQKSNFKNHASGAHIRSKPYNCLSCPADTLRRCEMAQHQKREHGIQMSKETFTFSGSKDEVDRVAEECFGSSKDIDYARLRCKPCGRVINAILAKPHVATKHLDKVLHRCLLCSYSSKDFSVAATNTHVRKTHGALPGKETVKSDVAQYLAVIKSMVTKLFEKT